MAENVVLIPWGKETIDLNLPDGWTLKGTLQPAALPPVRNVVTEVQRGLAEPIGASRLADVARPRMRVAIVVDDSSRPTPVNAIFPLVMAELEQAGVRREEVIIVPALGVHRGLEEAELAERLGAGWIPGLAWENPDCDSAEQMVNLGTTSRGTPVWISRSVAQADLVVSIGCIEPHIIASFGGGYKNILPGVAGRVSIAHNHAINCAPQTFNNVGRDIAANPMRLDLEEAGKMLKPPVFIVNAILNYRQELVRLVAGDPIQAHRAGAAISADLYGARVERPVDVVIAGSHPMDIDLRQGVKALANNIRAVRPGGVMMTFVRAEEGVGVFGLANRKLPLGKKALKFLAPVILPLVPKLKLNGMGEEDRFFLYFALQAMRHATLLMYGPTIPAVTQQNLPFVDFVSSPQEAMRQARQRFPGRATVLAIPHGGITYPNLV